VSEKYAVIFDWLSDDIGWEHVEPLLNERAEMDGVRPVTPWQRVYAEAPISEVGFTCYVESVA
jgi:hypothetical protein